MRFALLAIAAISVVFLIAGYAVRGEYWALGITVGVSAIAVAAVVHALLFLALWCLSELASAFEDPKRRGSRK